jgi:hypothetical protein
MVGCNPYLVIPAPAPDLYVSKLDPCFRRDDIQKKIPLVSENHPSWIGWLRISSEHSLVFRDSRRQTSGGCEPSTLHGLMKFSRELREIWTIEICSRLWRKSPGSIMLRLWKKSRARSSASGMFGNKLGRHRLPSCFRALRGDFPPSDAAEEAVPGAGRRAGSAESAHHRRGAFFMRDRETGHGTGHLYTR